MAVEASEAVGVLFRELYPQLVGLGVVLTGERELAEDLAQESFAQLLKAWERLRDPAAAPAYLRSTMVNLARSGLRRRMVRRRTAHLIAQPPDQVDTSERTALLNVLR